MRRFKSPACLIVTLSVIAGFLAASAVARSGFRAAGFLSNSRSRNLPRVMLWAWERPEDLTFIDPRKVGVAFLARTVFLRGERVIVRPRLVPVRAPRDAVLLAVVRIESDRFEQPVLSMQQRQKALVAIAEAGRIPGVSGLQIDFDARVSERAFYRDLLSDLRPALPRSMPLSITALASWCIGDPWISSLPIDEAVPMLFRMGPDGRAVVAHLQSGKDFGPAVCRQSLGVCVDERRPLPSGRRIYVFRPRAWSQMTLDEALIEVRQWQRKP